MSGTVQQYILLGPTEVIVPDGLWARGVLRQADKAQLVYNKTKKFFKNSKRGGGWSKTLFRL